MARKILKWLAIAIGVLIVAGAICQQVGQMMDAKLAPPEDEMIKVGGRRENSNWAAVDGGEVPRSAKPSRRSA